MPLRGGRAAATLRALRRRREQLDTAAALVRCASEIVQELDETIEPETARTALYGLSLLRQFIDANDFQRRLAALEQVPGVPDRLPRRETR